MAHIRPWPASLWTQVKRRVPTSLFGRSLLMIVLPIALMQVAVGYAFFDAHWRKVNGHLTDGLAGEVAWIARAYAADPGPETLRHLATEAKANLHLSVSFIAGATLPPEFHPIRFATADRALARALDEHLEPRFTFDPTRYPGRVDIRVQEPGGVLRILAPKERVFATQGDAFLFWLSLSTVILTAVSLLFIRNQMRAIERLAAAADAFGRGVDVSFRPHGAREVRQAAHAFIAMRRRISRHVEQRASLLAAVSHDLRTPLTRLKLELALAEPSSRIDAMKRDLADMERMIDEYLAFARGDEGESASPVLLLPLLREIAVGAIQAGADVSVQSTPELVVNARAGALKRALSNLVMNAAVHGETVEIRVEADAESVEVLVDDDGPGIPEERFEEAMTPFSRLDAARAGNEKGVGLGLAIARDVARGHGGDLTLGRSPSGGLRASLRLPVG